MNTKQLLLAVIVASTLVGCKCGKKQDTSPIPYEPESAIQSPAADEPVVEPVVPTPNVATPASAPAVKKCINGVSVNISVVGGNIQTTPVMDEYNNPETCS